MNVVIDTNILMSGIGWSGAPGAIIDAWMDDQFTVVATPQIIAEYKRVSASLSKKYTEVGFEPIIDKLLFFVRLFEAVRLPAAVSRDPDDDKFIACALSADAKLIVSGDADLLAVSGYQGITVLKPKRFVERCFQLT